MAREILFKAKRIGNGEWVEGFYCKRKHYCFDNRTDVLKAVIMTEFSSGSFVCYEVDKDTICQYTGLTDKNGNKIWENDIVEEDWGDYKGVVRFGEFDYLALKNIGFNIEWFKNLSYRQDMLYWADKSEVIGNIFDNGGELLNGN